MSLPNYVSYFFPGGAEVKVMRNVDEFIRAHGCAVFIDEETGYAAYGPQQPCKLHWLKAACTCSPLFAVSGLVHELTWKMFHPDRPLGVNAVIHHEVHKFDNRIQHLTKLTRAQHSIHHNRRRQKHHHRERFESGGLYKPRRPAPVTTVTNPEVLKELSPPAATARPPPFHQLLDQTERELALRYQSLFAELRHLDSGKEIPPGAPRAEWTNKETRRLGIRRPRLQCTPGEGAVVLASIKHQDKEDVVFAVAEELNARPDFIKEILKRTSVVVARERWAKYQRLPKVGRKQVRD